MSFTFNWAGVQGVTPVQVKDRDTTIRSDAAAWGSALRGYERRKADEEYADILDKQRRVNEIKARIQQLESRNAEIRSQMSTITPQTVQPYQPGPAFVSTPEYETPTNYPYSNQFLSEDELLARRFVDAGGDSSKFTRDEIKSLQSLVGVPNVDGIWGPQSVNYWNDYWKGRGRRFPWDYKD